ncbi:MAG: insulinase family protein [Akkermansiaceae bacterium]|nr:insulinase family protein [Akkermansiaceae bacterium]
MTFPPVTATTTILPNGLTLILDPDPAAPVVSAQLWIETGSIHEDRHLGGGLSHFLEHMVFKGTRDHDGPALAALVQAAGGHWNAYTTYDRTVYHIDGPAASLPVFLEVLTGLVFFPTLPAAEFENEKEVIRREIDMGLDDPDHALHQMVLGAAFASDPRRHPIIGHRHLFDSLRHEDLVGYHRRRYVPDRCFAVISGDFDPVAARERIAELTAAVPRGGGAEVVPACDPPQVGLRRARETFPLPHSRVAWVWKVPPLAHPDTPAYGLLAAVLGRGRASILHQRLRDDLGLALEISAWLWTGTDREGLFGICADAEVAKRDALIDAVAAELAKLADAPLEEDLAKAKRQIAVSQFSNLLNASGRAADLGGNWHEARDLDFTRNHLAAMERVTVADLRRVAAELRDERLTLGVLDPPDALPPARAAKTAPRRADIVVRQLANGASVALIEDRRVPLVRFQAAARAGLSAESAATSGLNQLLAATLPKGTRTRSAREIALALENLGAAIGASAGNNALLVHAGGLTGDLATIAEVFGESLRAPAFAPEIIERERASQLAALEESLIEPLPVAFKLLRRTLFGAAGFGLDLLGSPESLAALDRDALASQHARHFAGANLSLAVTGDFESAAVLDALETALAELPSGQPWSPPPNTVEPGGEAVARLPKKQAALAIGFPGAAVTGEDRFALAMLQEYVADMAGPLFSRLREELGLAYQVGGTQFLGHDTGLFTFYLATSPEQVDLARTELLVEIAKLAAEGIPAEAFERVRATVLSSLALQAQSPAAVAQAVALDVLFGLPADHHRRLTAIHGALTPAAVREVAARVFTVPPTIATVLPE